MFKAELERIKEFRSIVEGVSRIVDEMVIETDSEGLRAKALDRSHISFISFDLGVDFFTEYTLDEPMKMNVDMDQVLSVLKRGKSTDSLIISTEDNNIIFTFEGESTRKFKIHQIDMEYTSPEPPKIDTSVTDLNVPFTILKDAISDVGMVTDKIEIKVDNERLMFYGEGNYSDVDLSYLHGETLNLSNVVTSHYSIDFITYLLKINQVSDNIMLSLSDNSPLLLNLQSDDSRVEFLLAPRMSHDNDDEY